MQLIHCEIYQGAIAAAHVEFPSRPLYGRAETQSDARIISPVVINQLGGTTFLSPVSTVEEAITSAKAQIEHNNRSYMDYVIADKVAAENAVQHFEACGIPPEMVPPLALEQPYFPTYSTVPIRYFCQDASFAQ
ncbi:MAG: hypothetical protein ACFBSF_02040 [Leptolyngbyaceae cyanobacterium]